MFYEISATDWKLFRERLPIWQESYMEKLCLKYMDMLQSSASASDKFWNLEKRIKRDMQNPAVDLQIRKSTVLRDIAQMINTRAITFDDLSGFSDDFIQAVKHMVIPAE